MPAKRKAATAAVADENTSANNNWTERTVPELKEELEKRGLPKTGKKADLVSRLETADAGTLPTPEAKKRKKSNEATPDAGLEGPTAAELVQYQTSSASGERRLRPFVPAPDDAYREKFKKAKKERMFMLDRTKSVDNGGVISEIFDIAGSTGNIYNTTISRSPKCTCMDAVSRDWSKFRC
jgi:hypothetical protein